MQIGVVYPQIELGGDPDAVRRIGRATEELGFDHLLAYDHVLGAEHAHRTPTLTGPYTEHDPFHDPFVMFAYLAGRTERIGFVSGVIVLPQRQTALVARQVADLDLLSGGRFRLGVGVGWNHVEYQSLGQDFRTRGAREEEQIGLLRRLWTEPVVDFTGRFDRVDRAGTLPHPSRPVPIWLGGSSSAALDRAARLGDGFIFGGRSTNVHETWDRLRDLVSAQNREVGEFGGEYAVFGARSPSEAADRIRAWGEVGGTHASIVTMGMGHSSIDDHIEFLADVASMLGLPGGSDPVAAQRPTPTEGRTP